MNRHLISCMGLSILLAASAAALALALGGGWLIALAIYSLTGSSSLLALAALGVKRTAARTRATTERAYA